MSSTNVPLLNHYKKEFVYRRIPQTLLGGVNLRLGYSAPFYVFLIQILIWFGPWLVGGMLTIAIDIGGLSSLIGSIVAGCIFGLFVLTLQIVHFVLKQRSKKKAMDKTVDLSQSNLRHLLAQEDEIYFDACLSLETFTFVLPPKRFLVNVILHSVFAGLLCGVSVWYNLPSNYHSLYGNTAATVLLFIFSWVAVCIGSFPLMAGGVPPEVAAFHFSDLLELSSYSRPLHIFVFYAFHIVQVFDPSFLLANQVLHIVFVFLPFMWLSGLLPPIDAALGWLAEQLLIFGLGGSTVPSDLRLCLSFLLSGLLFLGSCFLPSAQALVLYSAVFGFLLSTDITSVSIDIGKKLFAACGKSSISTSLHDTEHLSSEPFVSVLAFGWLLAMFLMNTVIAALCFNYQALFSDAAKTGLQITFIVLFAVMRLAADAQKVYVFFRIFRNVLYPKCYSSHTQFKGRKRWLNVFGHIYFGLKSVVIPLLLTCYFSAFLIPATTQTNVLLALGATHAFRMTWQRSEHALCSMLVIGIVDLISSPSSSWFVSLDLGVRLLLLDVALDRSIRFADNIWFAFSLCVTSWRDKKQRRNGSILLLSLNVIFLPFVVLMAAIASLVAAPFLPLFTLPLFYVSFPRPSRFWPLSPGSATATVCSDTALYQQMAPDITRKLVRGLYQGRLATLGRTGTDTSFYLARSQDKTFWVQELESGYGYTCLSVKGLELQETSCHALEATRLDDACEAAFEVNESQSSCIEVNPYPLLSIFTPLDTVFVHGYSDAKTSLSGIIEQPQALKQLQVDFVKCIVWMLVHHECAVRQTNCQPLIHMQETTPRDQPAKKDQHQTIQLRELSSAVGTTVSDAGKQKNIHKRTPEPANKTDMLSASIGSLSSILSNDNASHDRRRSNSGKSKSPSLKIPGIISDDDDEEWEIESSFSDSGFGLPAIDVTQRKKMKEDQKLALKTEQPTATAAPSLDFPFSDKDLRPYHPLFDSSWHFHVTSVVEQDTGEMTSSGADDDRLLSFCRKVALACHAIVNVQGVPGRDPSLLGPSHVCKVFSGDIPWSPDLDWLKKNSQLHRLVTKAYRYAVKFMYDRAAMGLIDGSDDDFDDIAASLREYDCDWLIDMETSPDWLEAAARGKVSLFTIAYDDNKNEYSARTLMRRPVETHVGSLSAAAVRAFWANQSIELLYATNDDEERYSIQAHQALLRNLAVQAADPPLGYPVYSSAPIFQRNFPFPVIDADRRIWHQKV